MENMQHDTEESVEQTLDDESKEYAHFLKLDDEKKERILKAAYDEFLEKGYNEASTNIITQKADISKGLLFRYFGCKQGLYKFLMKESSQRIMREVLTELPTQSGDVFAIIESTVQLKIRVCLRLPKETSFLIAVRETNLSEELSQELKMINALSGNYFETLIDLLDGSLLRDGVEKDIAAEIISWVCEKYADKMLSSGMLGTKEERWKSVTEGLNRYMEALRHGLYKS